MNTQNHEPLSQNKLAVPIAILGNGRVGGNLAAHLAGKGLQVLLGTSNVPSSRERWTGPEVTFMDLQTAAREAEVVINALPGAHSLDLLGGLQKALAGKVLVDLANATRRTEAHPMGELIYPDSSLAEQLQEALPDTEVVKTLNTMMFKVMTDPHTLKVPPTVFLSGNSDTAKTTVVALLGELGWPAAWTLDLGDITTARGTEGLFMFVPHVVRRLGFVPFALSLSL